MLFDQLARITERSMPKLFGLVRQARLFVFEQKAQDVLPKKVSPEEQKFLYDNFFLPFEVAAVEDPVSCVILANAETDQIGMDKERLFVEILDNDSLRNYQASQDHEDNPQRLEEIKKLVDDAPSGFTVNVGSVVLLAHSTPNKVLYNGTLLHTFAFDRDGRVIGDYSQMANNIPQLRIAALRNASICLQEIMYINSPGRFILERKPLQTRAVRRQKDNNRIPRSHDRPIYTILEPGKIRERMKLPSPAHGGSVEPHERRRHFRRLQSEKFTNMKGQVIPVKACWIGPTESVVGKQRYKVMVDL